MRNIQIVVLYTNSEVKSLGKYLFDLYKIITLKIIINNINNKN